MERQPQPGDLVIYHDSKGVGHSALVTCTWSSKAHPLINLVYVSGDENRQDSYGANSNARLRQCTSRSPTFTVITGASLTKSRTPTRLRRRCNISLASGTEKEPTKKRAPSQLTRARRVLQCLSICPVKLIP